MIAMILLVLHDRIPDPVYQVLCRVYGLVSDRKLRHQARRPRRYLLMVTPAIGGPDIEWVRYIGPYQIPISSVAEAVARLTEAERWHPEGSWWIALGDGHRKLVTFRLEGS